MSRGMKLSKRHRIWFYGSFSLLFLSGLLWILIHYFVPYRSDWGETTHPIESWILKIHGAVAMIALIVLGTLIPLHIKKGWLGKVNLQTGVTLIGVNLILILTGYALYYTGMERIRNFSSWTHSVLGILLPAVIFWHVQEGRKLRKKKSRA